MKKEKNILQKIIYCFKILLDIIKELLDYRNYR